ncbi:MAG: hypothetical protein EPN53_10895 [Acidobacteria bacterium]|nr:MAG: hypothetical protein EPN53_10895 [Acidobacteriota bacterium]
MTTRKVATLAVAAAAFATPGHGAATRGFSLEVLLDGGVRAEYRARGAVYVEAVRGRPYVLRITNPLPCTVGVALAVDGLNTIDARHGDAGSAAKWVLPPYGTLEIPGWQVDGRDARRFTFTGERSSYGAWLGKTDDLGVIEAVFYREKARPIAVVPRPARERVQGRNQGQDSRSAGRLDAPAAAPPSGGGVEGGVMGGVEGVPVGEPSGRVESRDEAPAARKVSEEYAATGIGERTDHRVEWVSLDLEDRPAAVVRIRYEFRDQLVRLGVLPTAPDPLTRRERARGFSGAYCPEPSGGW